MLWWPKLWVNAHERHFSDQHSKLRMSEVRGNIFWVYAELYVVLRQKVDARYRSICKLLLHVPFTDFFADLSVFCAEILLYAHFKEKFNILFVDKTTFSLRFKNFQMTSQYSIKLGFLFFIKLPFLYVAGNSKPFFRRFLKDLKSPIIHTSEAWPWPWPQSQLSSR